MKSPLRTVFVLGMTTIVTVALVACIAPYTGLGMLTPMFALFLASWAAFAIILTRTFAGGVGGTILVSVAAFFLVLGLFVLEIRGLIAWREFSPPPRPMFHNYFGPREQALLPLWHFPWPAYDRAGNVMWADHEDNVLVAVVDGASEGSLTGPRTGHHETRFRVGDDSGRWITVQRSADLLVVIRPDGEVVRFPLSPKVVRGFHEECASGLTENLIADVGEFLYANSRAELQSFVSVPDRRRNGG